MSNITWTPEQSKAISTQGKNLLVSASAGSGKTTVMTKRIAEIVINKHIPISEFLVVTFTKASAEDMKKKIIEKLSEAQTSEFITEQIEAVQTSDISDLHSFYSRLVLTYFYEAQIDPGFHIVDELEATNLKTKAIERLFEQMEGQENFFRLADIFQEKRQDASFREVIFDFSDYLASFADGEEWFKRTLESSYNANLDQNECAKHINLYVCRRIEKLAKMVDDFSARCLKFGAENYYNYFVDMSSAIRAVKKSNSFTKNAKILFEIAFDTLPRVTEQTKALKPEVEAIKTRVKDEVDNFKANFISPDPKTLVMGIEQAKENLIALHDLTLEFEKIYAASKRDIGGLDFNDLERLAYKILQNDEIASAVRAKYKYVFVDEYQDINEIQEKIISIVSSKSNRFMVGDIKQSIYRFRLCDPEIFLQKYREYSAKNSGSEVIKLNCNFRSDKNILKFVDRVFCGVMTEEFGEIDYAADSKFIPGEDNLDDKTSTTLCYIDTTKNKEENLLKNEIYSVKNHTEVETDETKAIISEAKYVAHKISEIIENSEEEVKLSDFAILVFKRNPKVAKFIEVLKSLNIRISADEKYDMLTKNYIEEILNFAKFLILDNDDFLAFKVLKSKLFMFSDSELATMKQASPTLKFSDLIKLSKNIKNVELASKIKDFCKITSEFKSIAGTMTIAELCKKIVNDFKLGNLNLLLDDGENINSEIDKFISFLPNENAYDFLVDSSDFSLIYENEGGGDAVKLLTVHKSKGIEFKYVFLVNTSSKINFSSAQGKILYSKDFGVGLDYFDYDSRVETNSIPSSWIKMIEARKIAEEQQRVLYVALTRAIKKLFVICSMKRSLLHDHFPERPTTYINWFEPIILDCLDGKKHDEFVFENYTLEDLKVESKKKEKQFLLCKLDDVSVEKPFVYRHENSTLVPLKNSVSKILNGAGVDDDFDDEYEKREQVLDEETLKSFADRGTAYHKFFELFDFVSGESLDEQYDKVLSKMDKSLTQYIEKPKVCNVLNLDFFKQINLGDVLIKEREFFANFNAEIAKKAADGKIIMQGVVDLILVKNNQITILDYKTGRLNDEKLKKYGFQLNVYADAIERAFNMKVTRKLLCFIDEQKLIEI